MPDERILSAIICEKCGSTNGVTLVSQLPWGGTMWPLKQSHYFCGECRNSGNDPSDEETLKWYLSNYEGMSFN